MAAERIQNAEFLVPVETDPTFGQWLKIPMPPGADVLMLCKLTNHGYQPLRLLLPHQVYTREVRELLAAADAVTVIPVRSSEYITIARPAAAPLQEVPHG